MKELKLFLALTFLTGLVYPLLVTGISSLVFPKQAAGELDLIGQNFSSARYFHSRPSAVNYNPLPSGGSNLGPTSAELKKQIRERGDGPLDFITASASGLDPHISPKSAQFQIERIARERNLTPTAVQQLLDQLVEPPQFGILGEPRVNVLKLNQALDRLAP